MPLEYAATRPIPANDDDHHLPHCHKKNRVGPRAEGVPRCGNFSPAVEVRAREHPGELKVVKLDVDTAPAFSARYQVQGIPVLIRDGQDVDRSVGARPRRV
jgi:thioredoxin 2